MANRIFLLITVAFGFFMCSPTEIDLLENENTDSEPEPPQYEAMTTTGTLIRTSCADPCLIYEDGMFYLTMTGSSALVIVSDSDLGNLTTTAHPTTKSTYIYHGEDDPTVKAVFGDDATLSGTWSPELHYISEEDLPGYSGWYLFFGIRKSGDDSSQIRKVILKSRSGLITGPYVNPNTNEYNTTQILLDKNGNMIEDWLVGMSILRIPDGKYKGLYGTFVDEVGRGEGYGKFYQRIRIAKLDKPWQLGSDLYTVTTPTQDWEKKGCSSVLPMVVEGATAVYGDNGEIFMAYCGSGYWSDYGLGQLTLKRENSDYCDPLQQSSWIKYDNNPVFSSSRSESLRGAGHAFFLKDDAGNRFMCYHAYPYENGVKAKGRNAYIEPYTIDYSIVPDSAPQGLIRFGANKNTITAPVGTPVTFFKEK